MTPDVQSASSSSGLTVDVHNPQQESLNAEGLGEADVKDITVALPPGVAINPSGGDGLAACGEGLAGFTGLAELDKEFEPGVETATFTPTLPELEESESGVNVCPNAAKVGEAVIKTPLLKNPVKGFVYLSSQNQNPFGSLIAMYLLAKDPESGVTIKATGEVRLCKGAGEVIEQVKGEPVTCAALGQLVATFANNPQAPFEDAELKFFGGERAPLATPAHCGSYTTTAVLTPWSLEADEGPRTVSSTFDITSGPKTLAEPEGSACPGASLPFRPSLTGGALNVNAGAFSPFTATFSRQDGEQNMQSIEVKLPPGLSGVLSNIELCPEPQANLGECAANSLIGETTVSVGVGSQPFTVSGGKFYLTGPYNGSGSCAPGPANPGCAPFGVTFEVPAKAGPFDLTRNTANPAGEDACDCVIVRGKIEINPETAVITITSDPPGSPYAIPTSIEGIPLQIQHVNAITTRGSFQFNPTNCNKMEVTGTIHTAEGAAEEIGVPFQVTNCAALAFKPGFTVSTQGKTSRAKGASLTATVTYPKVPFGTDANIKQVKVELPKQLPSRLTTLQKACTQAQFRANPAGCPSPSVIGHAKAVVPNIPVPLEGPVYFVSNGGEAFPNLVIVLQGYNVTIDLTATRSSANPGSPPPRSRQSPTTPSTHSKSASPRAPTPPSPRTATSAR